jgi:plastocyanin
MRRRRLLIPLAVLSSLALASPTLAADASVNVVDFSFEPKEVQVGVGEKVTWNFAVGGHTTTSSPGQAERWNSGPATNPGGTSFEHTFTKPGRFSYVCIPHQSFMKGTVVVGTDAHRRSQSRFSQSRRGSTVTYRFMLVEAAKVSIRLSGEARRSASRRRLEPGRHSIRFRNVRSGRYKGTAAFTDDFGNRSVVRFTTTVR